MSQNTPDFGYGDASILPGSRELVSTEIEEAVIYARTDGKQIDMALAFIDMQDPLLLLMQYVGKPSSENDAETGLVLSIDEARLLRDLLNRPTVVAILEETKEQRVRRSPGFTLEEVTRLQVQLHGQ